MRALSVAPGDRFPPEIYPILPGNQLADCKSERIDQRWHSINDSFISMLHNDIRVQTSLRGFVGGNGLLQSAKEYQDDQECLQRGGYSKALSRSISLHGHT